MNSGQSKVVGSSYPGCRDPGLPLTSTGDTKGSNLVNIEHLGIRVALNLFAGVYLTAKVAMLLLAVLESPVCLRNVPHYAEGHLLSFHHLSQ